MSSFIDKIFRKKTNKTEDDHPMSMQDLRPGDPCWCGSGKSYRRCHRPEDRSREKELGLKRKGKSICDAFT